MKKKQEDIDDIERGKQTAIGKANAVAEIEKKAVDDSLLLKQQQLEIKKAEDIAEIEALYEKSNRSAEAYQASVDSIKLIEQKAKDDSIKLETDAATSKEKINEGLNKKIDLNDKDLQAKKAARLNRNAQLTKATLDLASALSSIYYNSQKTDLSKANKNQIEEARKAAKKQFEIQKAFQLAGAVVDGYKAVMSSYADTPGGPIIKGIAAVTAGIFSATQIAKISSSSFDESSFASAQTNLDANAAKDAEKAAKEKADAEKSIKSIGTETTSTSGSIGSGATQAVAVGPTGQNFNPAVITRQTSYDNGTTPGSAASSAPLKVYVLESDITNTQSKVSVVESKATVGSY